MRLTRYFHKRNIDSATVRGIRDLLKDTFGWGIVKANYTLYYPSGYYDIDTIKEVDNVVADFGQPNDLCFYFNSQGGRSVTIDTRGIGTTSAEHISIEVDNKGRPPSEIMNAIETLLSLERIGEVPSARPVSSAFVAYGFTDEGHSCANEVARFLNLLGVKCQSGRGFAPTSVAEKVKSRLVKHDILIAIATPQSDYTWLTQEMATAAALEKPLFILKHADVTFKEGILGDHEYIPFPPGQVSRTFIPILEGLTELAGHDSGFF